MLKIRSAVASLGNRRPTSLNTWIGGHHNNKHYSSGAKSRWWSHTLRTYTLWALGGGAAVGAAVLLHPDLRRDAVVGLQEAGCQEGEKGARRRRDAFPEAPWKRVEDRTFGVGEAIRMSRELLQRTKDETGSPGIVAAVSINGNLLWAEGLGYADVENRLPCTADSVLRIASISKSFTMTAVAKLWEEGKLDLDKPIQHYVPAFPKKEFDGEKVDINTRQLVSHLAGIRHYSKDYIKTLANQQPNKDDTTNDAAGTRDSHDSSKDSEGKDTGKRKKTISDSKLQEFHVTKNYSSVVDALDMFKEDPLMHKPGSKFHYTTHGWTLVSAIVDAAADQDFLAHMKALFRDLGMPHTAPDQALPLIYNRARGYQRNKKGRLVNAPAVNLSHKWAGGGYLSDVRDLIQFGNAMLYSYQYTDAHKGAGLPRGYLKPETMKAVWCPVPLTECSWDRDGSYAMGWAVRDQGESPGFCPEKHHLISHTGGAVGASSVLLVVNQAMTEPVQGADGSPSRGVRHGDGPAWVADCDQKHPPTPETLSLPRGIVVAIIVNLEDVGLYKAAVEVAEIFKRVDSPL